ncbi:hypothetical protein [Alkaliflexus imshenetskii]|jgi:hypothetical protein|uniref:hypothetical protein n=1 Tax=Alkaliflexus imshenetskii TaxID=286730 RepID=UPI00047E460C|nr:hypothetical protein [Alkaliflexus imshenetskii]
MLNIKPYFSLFIILILFASSTGCQPAKPPVEDQVREAYQRFEVILNMGVTSILTLTLQDGEVQATITRPTNEQLEEFFILFTENPLCQDTSENDDIISCLAEELKKNNCVRIATCRTCIYSCE